MAGQSSHILIRNARVVDVFRGEVIEAEVLISGDKIARVGQVEELPEDMQVIDASGKYLAPGFIDSHVHIESSMMTPLTLSHEIIKRGTTTIVADPHEIAMVLGVKGLTYMIEEARQARVRIFFTVPDWILTQLLEKGQFEGYKGDIIGLGEVSPYFFSSHQDFIEACQRVKKLNLNIEGHLGPNFKERRLDQAAYFGVSSCHESITQEEALQKLSRGMTVIVREGSAAKNLVEILGGIKEKVKDTRKFVLGPDDLEVMDIFHRGEIDHCLRLAVDAGIHPLEALQMATINSAQHFGLEDRLGSVTPGRYADLVLLEDLEEFKVAMVISAGEVVYADHEIKYDPVPIQVPDFCLNSFKLNRKLSAEDFKFRVEGSARKAQVRVIEAVDGQITSFYRNEFLDIKHGEIKIDLERDILKIAVVERYQGEGRCSKGFIRSFGLKRGAIATSVAHDEHNIIVVGANDQDLAFAVNEIARLQGGLVAVDGGEVKGRVKLPVAGLMANVSAEQLYQDVSSLHRAVKELGSSLESPFMTLSFICLPVPELKIDKNGLLDVYRNTYVDPVIDLFD
ncbi:adenine deaminase [Candidatus Hakubella thermalkaliphila]|uniref:Adenine deaminase n=3 Tax=Candidatus Hakubella thermalkaliphila TaxID=2754717 RepID=A0A6V8PGF5_9ACTN|nr:adenine deaminase [Candidatus Hakubella thermalkaliphila]GFP29901.1 adenine deaminase [Candidatus Hakubella thermalkaliphila]GFP39570.1 adenine deaminase [Candidatus Hakubella thermalkaliphila]GFP42465.1 adenine deaminase [Candidatus Hakubella thermalkaliphila]